MNALTLRIGLLGLLALHAIATWVWPGKLWGASQLAVWSPVWAIAMLAVAAVFIVVAPRPMGSGRGWPFPGRRGAIVAALAAGALFWLLREGSHFFGDGYLLIRSRGMSTTVLRAPALVRPIVWIVRTLEEDFGVSMETALASVSVGAGMLSVFLGLRWCAALDARREVRWMLAVLLGTAGAVQLFFGHVEYYAALVPPLLGYLLVTTHALHGRAPWWSPWVAFAVLPAVHLSTLGLVPAQAWLGVVAWRRGERRHVLWGAIATTLATVVLLRVFGSDARQLAATSTAGIKQYLQPYFDRASSRHAFGLATPKHWLAIFNDLILIAPLAVAALPSTIRARSTGHVGTFLGVGALGCFGLDIAFNREVGPYRDWNILAPYAFVYLGWTGVVLARAAPAACATMTRALLAAGLLHLVPWIATNRSPERALAHLRLVLDEPGGWSPYSRGYMHEELAIRARDRGDLKDSQLEYAAAVAANPSDARYHVGLGDMSFRLGDHQRAIEEYEIALRARPDFMPAHNNLAAVLASKGLEPQRALQHAEAAVRLVPTNFDAQLTYAGALKTLGRYAEARAALEQARKLRPAAGRELDPQIEMLRRMEMDRR